MHEYKAELIRVIDGDTIDALIDLGFDLWIKKRIRLFGLDAPEVRTKDLVEKSKGLEAKNKLIELLGTSDGKFILLSNGIGKYGRCLGTLFINKKNINDLLISEGYAKKY